MKRSIFCEAGPICRSISTSQGLARSQFAKTLVDPTETLMRLFGSECQIRELPLLKGKVYCCWRTCSNYKTSQHNEEVNNTEPFPSLSVPWLGCMTNRSNMSRHLFIGIVSDTTWSTATATALAALARSLPRPTTLSAPSESPSTPESVASGCSTETSPTLSKQGDRPSLMMLWGLNPPSGLDYNFNLLRPDLTAYRSKLDCWPLSVPSTLV